MPKKRTLSGLLAVPLVTIMLITGCVASPPSDNNSPTPSPSISAPADPTASPAPSEPAPNETDAPTTPTDPTAGTGTVVREVTLSDGSTAPVQQTPSQQVIQDVENTLSPLAGAAGNNDQGAQAAITDKLVDTFKGTNTLSIFPMNGWIDAAEGIRGEPAYTYYQIFNHKTHKYTGAFRSSGEAEAAANSMASGNGSGWRVVVVG